MVSVTEITQNLIGLILDAIFPKVMTIHTLNETKHANLLTLQ